MVWPQGGVWAGGAIYNDHYLADSPDDSRGWEEVESLGAVCESRAHVVASSS